MAASKAGRRMIRRLLNFITFVSACFCALIVMLWARSYRVCDQFLLERVRYVYSPSDSRQESEPIWLGRIIQGSVSTNRGVFNLYLSHEADPLMLAADNLKDWSETYSPGVHFLWSRQDPIASELHFEDQIFKVRFAFERFGFLINIYQTRGISAFPDFNVHEAAAPAWFLALLTALLPSWRAIRHWRNIRQKNSGRCRRCGYDLTANISGVCPECGTPISQGMTVCGSQSKP